MSDNMSEVNIDSAEIESVDIVSLISKERRDVYYAMACSRAWKAKAKQWRKDYYAGEEFCDEQTKHLHQLESDYFAMKALAADRLELLMDHEWVLVPRGMGQVWKECLHCENDIEQGHADNCKLLNTKELGE